MTRWLISVPVWGDHNRRVFAERAAPALREALRLFDHDVRFLVYTDEPEFIRGVLGGFKVKIVAIRPDTGYTGLQDTHMDGIWTAAPGERVAFLTADLVVSPNLFTSCEARLAAGKKLVMMAGTRTDIACGPPPLVTTCRDLLMWGWESRHQIIRDVEWGTGASSTPTTLYFTRGEQVVMHGFHLSPIAMVKGPQEIIFDTTVDNALADYFDLDDIHIVQSPDEACTLEISASERRFPVRYEPMDEKHVARIMRTLASSRHRELFSRRIIICDDGSDDPWEMPIVENILALLEQEPEPEPEEEPDLEKELNLEEEPELEKKRDLEEVLNLEEEPDLD